MTLIRLIERPRPWWVTLTISLLLILIPIGAVILDGYWTEIYASGFLRHLMLPAVLIVYFVVISPPMANGQLKLVGKLRPLVQVDDAAFEALIREHTTTNPRSEWLAFGIGALLGLLNSLAWDLSDMGGWTRGYMYVSFSLMFGLLAWAIYGSISATKLLTALHRQPLKIDLFDTRPFQPVGQYSLLIALAYIGGIVLSLIFGLDLANLFAWQVWVGYIPLASAAVLIFFLSMRDTHRVLVAEKQRCLSLVRARIGPVRRLIQEQIEAGGGIDSLAGEFNALLAYEVRVQNAPTWPYNTAMARALFFAILLPLMVRLTSVLLFER